MGPVRGIVGSTHGPGGAVVSHASLPSRASRNDGAGPDVLSARRFLLSLAVPRLPDPSDKPAAGPAASQPFRNLVVPARRGGVFHARTAAAHTPSPRDLVQAWPPESARLLMEDSDVAL